MRIWIRFLLGCQHSTAALLVRDDAKKLPAFLTRMEVQVMALDDRLTVSI